MTRLSKCSFVVAALLGSFIIADIAEAQRPRNPVERRLRPSKGFWDNSSSSSFRSYSSRRPVYRSTQRYSAPVYSGTRMYGTAPVNSMPVAPVAPSAPATQPQSVQPVVPAPAAAVQPGTGPYTTPPASTPVAQHSYVAPTNAVVSRRVLCCSPIVSAPRIISERVIPSGDAIVKHSPAAVATQPSGNAVRR